MTDPAQIIIFVIVVGVLAGVLVAAVGVESTIVGMLLERGGMPHGRWACGIVTGLLLAVALGICLVVAQALGMF